MARQSKLRLTDRTVRALKAPGYHNDGDGLYLRVTAALSKYWVYRFRWPRRAGAPILEMGLGQYDTVGLVEARAAAGEARKLLKGGYNPIEARKVARREATATGDEVPTFERFALDMIEVWAPGWKSSKRDGADNRPKATNKQRQNWEKTVTAYCKPIGLKLVSQVTTEDVVTVLQPLWTKTPEIGDKTRRRLAKILDAAKVKGFATGDNPARWAGHLEHLLPAQRRAVRHHPAMPYKEIPAFMQELRKVNTRGARALEFLLFTVVRTSEVCFAEKGEIDDAQGLWTIPPERMKGTNPEEHVVPLVEQALRLARVAASATRRDNPWLFGTPDHGNALSTGTMDKLLQEKLGYKSATVHGFRSSFKDWADSETEHARETAEMSLSHRVGNATEMAYWRARRLEKRRLLLQDWADYIDPPGERLRLVPSAGAVR